MEQLYASFQDYHSKLKNFIAEGKSSYYNTTGFNSLDNVIMGYFWGELVLVASRPGMGMSTFLTETALNIAIHKTYKVGYVNLGKRKRIFNARLIAMITGLSYNAMLRLELSKEELEKIEVNEDIKSIPLYLQFPDTNYFEDVIPQLYIDIEEHQLQYLIIDDIHSFTSKDRKSYRSRYDELNEIVRQLKTLAEKTNIILICSSRLSRKVEESYDKRPLLSHLRESGMLEDSADKVLMLYRPEYYKIQQDANGNSTDKILEVMVSKNTSGPTKNVEMMAFMDNDIFRIKEVDTIWGENWQDNLLKMIEKNDNNYKPKNNDDTPF